MNGARAGTARVLARMACALHDLTIPPEQRGWQPAPAPLHPVEAHADGLGHLLEEVYRESLLLRRVPRGLRRPHPDCGPPGRTWLLDTRVPLAQARLLRPIAARLVEVLVRRRVRQVVGRGYGSFLLVGGMLGADDRLRAGLVREARKDHGARRLIEGSLRREEPLIVVDDVISTGRSAAALVALLRAEGYDPQGVLALFRYGWRGGAATLGSLGIPVETLATIHPPLNVEAVRGKRLVDVPG